MSLILVGDFEEGCAAGGVKGDQARDPAGGDERTAKGAGHNPSARRGNALGREWEAEECGPYPVPLRHLAHTLSVIFGWRVHQVEPFADWVLGIVESEDGRKIDRSDLAAYDVLAVLDWVASMEIRPDEKLVPPEVSDNIGHEREA